MRHFWVTFVYSKCKRSSPALFNETFSMISYTVVIFWHFYTLFLHWISSLPLEIQCKYFIFSSSVEQQQNNEESKRIEEFFEEKMFCHHCDDSLAGHRYVLRDDHPYCIKCYENVFANNCDECGKIIGIDSKDLSYKEKHWHEACFVCSKCRTSLVDKQFGSKADRIYCGPCYDAQFATRCDGCGDVFRAGKYLKVRFENVKVALSCHLWPLEQKNRNSNVCKCQRIQWCMIHLLWFRHEENGVQDEAMAREMLRLLRL